jgi:outer membrane protein TolC
MKPGFCLIGCFLIVTVSFVPLAYADEGTTLEQAWVSTYQNNPSLEAERARLRALDEKVAQSISHWRPAISLNSGVGRNWPQLAASVSR